MANLLADPDLWSSTTGGPPPMEWTGERYEFISNSSNASYLNLVSVAPSGATIVGTLDSTLLGGGSTYALVIVEGDNVELFRELLTEDIPVVFDVPVTAGVFASIGIEHDPGGASTPYDIEVTITPTADPVPPATVSYNCECDDATNNATLAQLRTRLMSRLGYGAQAANPPPGMVVLLNDFIIGAQESLYRRYDVLRTERFFSWPLAEGVRLYDLPDNAETCTKKLDPRKLTWVGVERDGIWRPLICGIPPELYTHDVTGRPERYEIRQCIEVWPVPEETNGNLVIKGRFELEAFAADGDKTTIDSELVFLLALANAKAHYGQPDANNYVAQMETMMMNLVAGAHHTRRYIPGHDRREDMVYVTPKPTVPFPT